MTIHETVPKTKRNVKTQKENPVLGNCVTDLEIRVKGLSMHQCLSTLILLTRLAGVVGAVVLSLVCFLSVTYAILHGKMHKICLCRTSITLSVFLYSCYRLCTSPRGKKKDGGAGVGFV